MQDFKQPTYIKNCEVTQKKITLVGKEPTNEKVYAVGDMFITSVNASKTCDESCIYVLVQTNPKEVKLINLRNGNRFNSGVTVKDIEAITQEEFKLIASYLHDTLVKIKSIDFKINALEELESTQ